MYPPHRLAPVRHAVRTAWRPLLFAYAAGILIGGQVLVLVLLVLTPSLGEAVQLHAWLGLATALPLGAWTALASATEWDAPRVGAVLIGLAAASTTVFLLLSGLVYFAYAGDFALPLSQRLSELLGIMQLGTGTEPTDDPTAQSTVSAAHTALNQQG